MSVVLKPQPVKPNPDDSETSSSITKKLSTLPTQFHTQNSKNSITNKQKYASASNLNSVNAISFKHGPSDLKTIAEKSESSNTITENKNERKSLFKKNNPNQTLPGGGINFKRNSVEEQTPKRSKFLELKKFFSSSSSSQSPKSSVNQSPNKKCVKTTIDSRSAVQIENSSKSDSLYNQMNAMQAELTKLKTQLNHEVLNSNQLKFQINDLNRKLNKKLFINATTQTVNYDYYNLQKINDELNNLRQQIDHERKKFENEKEKWCNEKEKVLKFQQFLQVNYAQSINQNKILQNQIETLKTCNKMHVKHMAHDNTYGPLSKQCHQFI